MANNLAMPIWTCPKCGSNEVYEGTVIHQQSSGAVGFIGEQAGESSISPIIHRPLGSKSVEATVTKCKHCDIILGEKDKVYTHAELTAAQERKEQQLNNIPVLVILAAAAYGFFTLALITSHHSDEQLLGVALLVGEIFLLIGIWQTYLGNINPSKVCTVAAFLQIPLGIFAWRTNQHGDIDALYIFLGIGFAFWVLGKFYPRTDR